MLFLTFSGFCIKINGAVKSGFSLWPECDADKSYASPFWQGFSAAPERSKFLQGFLTSPFSPIPRTGGEELVLVVLWKSKREQLCSAMKVSNSMLCSEHIWHRSVCVVLRVNPAHQRAQPGSSVVPSVHDGAFGFVNTQISAPVLGHHLLVSVAAALCLARTPVHGKQLLTFS